MLNRVNQLATLMKRGRQLHFENLRKLAKTHLQRNLPDALSPRLELVYAAIQLVIARAFITQRGYLPRDQLEVLFSQLVGAVAGKNEMRLQKLIAIYEKNFDNEKDFTACVSLDICHAILEQADSNLIRILQTTPRVMLKTTHIYCAMTFGDSEVMRRLN